jgi:hypothetical protein
MPELKKFLRFEISGYVALLYAFLFCLALSDMKKIGALVSLEDIKIIDYAVTGFILAGPIGFIMHQMDITIFSPFRKCRFFLNCRKVISVIEQRIGSSKINYDDNKFQAVLEFALSKEVNKHLVKEISNRYSYYYARMEAGLFSPILGFIIYLITNQYFQNINNANLFFSRAIIFGIIIISFIILGYCPTILRELNDLECLALEQGLKDLKDEELKNIL